MNENGWIDGMSAQEAMAADMALARPGDRILDPDVRVEDCTDAQIEDFIRMALGKLYDPAAEPLTEAETEVFIRGIEEYRERTQR